jgi:hypothetical protein
MSDSVVIAADQPTTHAQTAQSARRATHVRKLYASAGVLSRYSSAGQIRQIMQFSSFLVNDAPFFAVL